jgi:hypothetical protein
MKFESTSFTNKKDILKFPDHYVALAVTVDDLGIVANADGKKIVLAGTIVGGGTLANAATVVKEHVPASLTTALVGNNNDLLFTAKVDNTVKVALVDPAGNDKPISVAVTADTITVSLATGPAGAITSKASDVKAAIEGNYLANELISVGYPAGNDGTGVVTVLEATALAGGISAEGVLLDDVDVTYGDASGAMVIHGFIDEVKLPKAPSVLARKSLKGITFIK